MKNFTSEIAIISYDANQYTEKEIEILQAEILRDVPVYERIPSTVYYDKKKNHFMFENVVFDTVANKKLYLVQQVVKLPEQKTEKPKSKLIKLFN